MNCNVIHAIREIWKKQVDWRGTVRKVHTQIGLWGINRLSYDQQDGEKVNAKSQRCETAVGITGPLSVWSEEAGMTKRKRPKEHSFSLSFRPCVSSWLLGTSTWMVLFPSALFPSETCSSSSHTFSKLETQSHLYLLPFPYPSTTS